MGEDAETMSASDPRPESDGGRDESELERLDRNLNELLQELRVVLPGVQVLFAFLLTVPFSNGFPTLSSFQRDVYFVVLAMTAIATAMFLAPTAYHRLLFREGMKREIVDRANRLAILGLGVLALAMSAAIFLIAHIVFAPATAVIAGVAALALFGSLWCVFPLRLRRTAD
jgi:hypothetical protein